MQHVNVVVTARYIVVLKHVYVGITTRVCFDYNTPLNIVVIKHAYVVVTTHVCFNYNTLLNTIYCCNKTRVCCDYNTCKL